MGGVGLLTSVIFGSAVLISKFVFSIPVPGYAATVMLIVFFGALNCFGLGVLGSYLWRTYENSKGRPSYLVATEDSFHNDQHTTP